MRGLLFSAAALVAVVAGHLFLPPLGDFADKHQLKLRLIELSQP